jgi:hypothetical protein
MKRLKKLLLVLTLNIVWGSCWVNSANAGVITMGTWSAMDPNAAAFWNNASWDGPGQNVGQLITSWGWSVEQLSLGGSPVSFAFEQPESFTEVASITAWKDGRGINVLPDGSVNFTTHGFSYNSLITPWQFSLFRAVGPTQITYFLGIEDIPFPWLNDHDYNDYIGYAYEQLPPLRVPDPIPVPDPRPVPDPAPVPTPEPGTLTLMLCGGLAAFRKMRSLRS